MAFFCPLNCTILSDCVCCCTPVTVPDYTNRQTPILIKSVFFFAIYIFLFSQVLASIFSFFPGDRKDVGFNLWQTNRCEVAWFVSVLGTYQVKILGCIAYVVSVVMRREWEIVVPCFLKEIIAKKKKKNFHKPCLESIRLSSYILKLQLPLF